MKRTVSILAVLVWAALLALPVAAATAPAPKARLNVLLVTVDTLRADRVGIYGNSPVSTPAIDKLAKRGTVFMRAFAHAPLTLPSHTSILTGLTPLAHGVHDNIDFVVSPENVTLAERLKAEGYRTAAFVSASPLDSRFGLDQGFDVYDDTFMAPGTPKTSPAEQKAETTVGKALKWLESAGDGPWLLWIHVYDPHSDYAPPEPYRSRYKANPYDGEVAYTDFALGRLFRTLDEKAMSGRTVIVLTADHGEGLGDHGERTHGFLTYNSTLRVPLVIAAPGLGPARSAEPVALSDIVPTVLDLLGLPVPAGLQGRSVRAALSGESIPPRKIYFECLSPYYEMGWAPIQGYIEGDKKYIDSPLPEVYDLASDLGERKNLASTAGRNGCGPALERLIAELTPEAPVDSRAKTGAELKEKLESLGYLGSAGGSNKSVFTADDDPKTLLPLFNRIMDAYNLKSQGRHSEAVQELESLIREEKTLDAAYVNLASLYLDSKDRAKALEVLAAGWRRFPSSYDLLTSYVANLVAAQRWRDVVEVVDEAPNLPQMEHDGEVWFCEGLAFLKLRDTARAAAAFERAVAADGEYLAALYNAAAAHLSLFLRTKDQEQGAEAIPLFLRVIALDPKNAEAHALLGRAYLESGQTDQAITMLETARNIKPDLVSVEYQLGQAFLAKRDYERAYAHLLAYKERAYQDLSPGERASLDSAIQECLAANH
jgi:tetratricopeptide (TPR) repeat protein